MNRETRNFCRPPRADGRSRNSGSFEAISGEIKEKNLARSMSFNSQLGLVISSCTITRRESMLVQCNGATSDLQPYISFARRTPPQAFAALQKRHRYCGILVYFHHSWSALAGSYRRETSVCR